MDIPRSYPFGDMLKGFRIRAGMSRHELAQKLGVHRNTLAHWEVGNILPRQRVREIADALGLNEQELHDLQVACGNVVTASEHRHQIFQLGSSPKAGT